MTDRRFRIAQESHREGSAWWRWSTWIEGSPADLDSIEEVLWHLHPTFSPSLVPCRDRSTKFRLDSSGWGEFTLRATIATTQGESISLRHQLQLEAGEATASVEPGEVPHRGAGEVARTPSSPRIYLAYSLADVDLGKQLEASLRSHGARVEIPNQESGAAQSMAASVVESIAASDAVVVVNSNAAGEFVGLESQLATARSKPVFEVLVGSVKLPPNRASATPHHFHLDRKDATTAVESLTRRVLDSLHEAGRT